MDELAEVVRSNGGPMKFADFVQAANVAGLQPRRWLQAKHAGVIATWIDQEGNHMVGLPADLPQGEGE